MTRMNVRVRPAVHEDIPALCALLQTVEASAGKKLTDSDLERRVERFIDVLASDRTLLVAAEESGTVVGLLAASRDEIGTIDLTPALHVTHLMVAPGQRRRGIARSLLIAAVQLADDQGVDHVVATASAGSREGNRYLARLGFAPMVVHRLAATSTLRRSLGISDSGSRVAVLRRARLIRAQRSGFASSARGAGRGA